MLAITIKVVLCGEIKSATRGSSDQKGEMIGNLSSAPFYRFRTCLTCYKARFSRRFELLILANPVRS